MFSLPIIFDWTSEKQVMWIGPIFEQIVNFLLHTSNHLQSTPFDDITVVLSHPKIQIYNSKLVVVTELKGITYYMYHWLLFSASVGVSAIALIQLFIIAIISILIYARTATQPTHRPPSPMIIVDDEEKLLNQILERSRNEAKNRESAKAQKHKNSQEEPDKIKLEPSESKSEIIKVEAIESSKKSQEEVEDVEEIRDTELRLRKKSEPKDQENQPINQ
jgi:hypothetical protein